MAEDNEQLAFKDFEGAVTKKEFLAVLDLAKGEYLRLMKVIDSHNKFAEKANHAMKAVKSQQGQMPSELVEKLVEGLKRRADGDVYKHFKEPIDRHRSIVDFLNRFNNTKEELEYLDFSFINKE